MKNLKQTKSGQLFIISSFLLLIGLVFIYSLETENSYIANFGESIIIENIIYETCELGYQSNGSYIETHFTNFQNLVNQNCLNKTYKCELTITKQLSAPTNLSLLNFTHFNYNLKFTSNTLNYSNTITC